MGTTEEMPPDLNSMPDHFAFAMLTNRSHHMDGALETVEYMPRSSGFDYEGLVVFVAAAFALRHRNSPRAMPHIAGVGERRAGS